MNPEIQQISEEIAKLRESFTEFQAQHKALTGEKREYEHGYQAKMQALRDEYNAKLLHLQESRRTFELELDELYRQMMEAERSLEEKNKLYAKLLEKMNDSAFYEELSASLAEICVGFEAYFKAHVYQHEDILFTIGAYQKGLNGILNANDLGLGKTFESIVSVYILSKLFVEEHDRKPRILWLTKKSLVTSTPKEIQSWWPECKVMSSSFAKTPKDRNFLVEIYMMGGDILLTNYEFIRTTKVAADIQWDLIVIDEVHKLKGGANQNGPTAIWEAVKNVCRKARFTLMLSGTPMVNRAEEMWSYLHIFNPEKFPSIRQFENNFMELKSVLGETKYVVSPDKILSGALKGQMIRRRRDEVGLQLPELTRDIRTLEMNPEQSQIYQQMRNNFFVWLDTMQTKPLTATAIIAQLTRLRQINVWPAGIKIKDLETEKEIHLDVQDSSKIDECMDIIEEAADQVVVFSTFNEPLREVQIRCRKLGLSCEVINGESVNKMGEYENGFQQKQIDVLCINSAMGEGLNLQKNPDKWPGGSAVAIFLDLWWSPARNEQCEGRIHRQGANMPVNIYVLQNDNSIDAFIEAKLMDKRASFESIMESDEIRPASDWRDFLEGMI